MRSDLGAHSRLPRRTRSECCYFKSDGRGRNFSAGIVMLPTRPEAASRTTKRKFRVAGLDHQRETGFVRKKRNTLRRPVVEKREVFFLQVFEQLAFSIFQR